MSRMTLDDLKAKIAITQQIAGGASRSTFLAASRPESREAFGLTLMIENPKGSKREGVDRRGKRWSSTLKHDYGYIARTKGADGEGIDVFVGPCQSPSEVYVVHTNDRYTSTYDECKVMLGFATAAAAKDAFLANYDSPKHYRSMTIIPMASFKKMMTGSTPGAVRWTRKNRRAHATAALFSAGESAASQKGLANRRPGNSGGSGDGRDGLSGFPPDQSRSNVPLPDSGPSDGKPAVNKSLPNGSLEGTEGLGNLRNAHAGFPESLRLVNAPGSGSVVNAPVDRLLGQKQVVDRVVQPVPVAMVNNLRSKQFSSEVQAHNKPVLKNLPAVVVDKSVEGFPTKGTNVPASAFSAHGFNDTEVITGFNPSAAGPRHEFISGIPFDPNTPHYAQGKNPASHGKAPAGGQEGGGGQPAGPKEAIASPSDASTQATKIPAADKPTDQSSPLFDKKTASHIGETPPPAAPIPHHHSLEAYQGLSRAHNGEAHDDETAKAEHAKSVLAATANGHPVHPEALHGHDDETAKLAAQTAHEQSAKARSAAEEIPKMPGAADLRSLNDPSAQARLPHAPAATIAADRAAASADPTKHQMSQQAGAANVEDETAKAMARMHAGARPETPRVPNLVNRSKPPVVEPDAAPGYVDPGSPTATNARVHQGRVAPTKSGVPGGSSQGPDGIGGGPRQGIEEAPEARTLRMQQADLMAKIEAHKAASAQQKLPFPEPKGQPAPAQAKPAQQPSIESRANKLGVTTKPTPAPTPVVARRVQPKPSDAASEADSAAIGTRPTPPPVPTRPQSPQNVKQRAQDLSEKRLYAKQMAGVRPVSYQSDDGNVYHGIIVGHGVKVQQGGAVSSDGVRIQRSDGKTGVVHASKLIHKPTPEQVAQADAAVTKKPPVDPHAEARTKQEAGFFQKERESDAHEARVKAMTGKPVKFKTQAGEEKTGEAAGVFGGRAMVKMPDGTIERVKPNEVQPHEVAAKTPSPAVDQGQAPPATRMATSVAPMADKHQVKDNGDGTFTVHDGGKGTSLTALSRSSADAMAHHLNETSRDDAEKVARMATSDTIDMTPEEAAEAGLDKSSIDQILAHVGEGDTGSNDGQPDATDRRLDRANAAGVRGAGGADAVQRAGDRSPQAPNANGGGAGNASAADRGGRRRKLLEGLSDAGAAKKNEDGSWTISRAGGPVAVRETKDIPIDDAAYAASISKYGGKAYAHPDTGAPVLIPSSAEQIQKDLQDPGKRAAYRAIFKPLATFRAGDPPSIDIDPDAGPEHLLEEFAHHAFHREITNSDRSELLNAMRWFHPSLPGGRATAEEAEEMLAQMVAGDGERGEGAKARDAMANWSRPVRAAYERMWDSVHEQSSKEGEEERSIDSLVGSAGDAVRHAVWPKPGKPTAPTIDDPAFSEKIGEFLHAHEATNGGRNSTGKDVLPILAKTYGKALGKLDVQGKAELLKKAIGGLKEYAGKANKKEVLEPGHDVPPGTPNLPHGPIELAAHKVFLDAPTKSPDGKDLPGPTADQLAAIPGAPKPRTNPVVTDWSNLDPEDEAKLPAAKRVALAEKTLTEAGAKKGKDFTINPDGKGVTVSGAWLDQRVRVPSWQELRNQQRLALAGTDNHQWYKEVAEKMTGIVGEKNKHEAATILAITSPQKSFELNVSEALTIMKAQRDLYNRTKGKYTDQQLFDAIKGATRPGVTVPARRARQEADKKSEIGGPFGDTIVKPKETPQPRLGISGPQIKELVRFYREGGRANEYKTTTFGRQTRDADKPDYYDPSGVMDVHMARFFGDRTRDIERDTGGLIDSAKSPDPKRTRWMNYLNAKLAGETGLQGDQAQSTAWLWAKQNLSQAGGEKAEAVPWHLAKQDAYGIPKKNERGETEFDPDRSHIRPGTIQSYEEMAKQTGELEHFKDIKDHPFQVPQGDLKAGGEIAGHPEYSKQTLEAARQRAAAGAAGAIMGSDANPNTWKPPEGRVADAKEAVRLRSEIEKSLLDDNGKVKILSKLGIPHEVVRGQSSYGGQEGNLTIRPLSTTLGDTKLAHFVGSLLGKFGHQAAYIVDHPHFDAPTNQGLAIGRKDGQPMSPEEINKVHAAFNPKNEIGGSNFSATPDLKQMKYLHENWSDPVGSPAYDDGFEKWAKEMQEKMAMNGLSGYTLEQVRGKTDYVGSRTSKNEDGSINQGYGHELARHLGDQEYARRYGGEALPSGPIGGTGHSFSPKGSLRLQDWAVGDVFEPTTETYLRNGFAFDPVAFAHENNVPPHDMEHLFGPALKRIAQRLAIKQTADGKWVKDEAKKAPPGSGKAAAGGSPAAPATPIEKLKAQIAKTTDPSGPSRSAAARGLKRGERIDPSSAVSALPKGRMEKVGNVSVMRNPTKSQLLGMARRAGEYAENGEVLRGMAHGSDYIWWPASDSIHNDVAEKLGLNYKDWYPTRLVVAHRGAMSDSVDPDSEGHGESFEVFAPDYGNGHNHPQVKAMRLRGVPFEDHQVLDAKGGPDDRPGDDGTQNAALKPGTPPKTPPGGGTASGGLPVGRKGASKGRTSAAIESLKARLPKKPPGGRGKASDGSTATAPAVERSSVGAEIKPGKDYWISPSGKPIEAPEGLGHDGVASKSLGGSMDAAYKGGHVRVYTEDDEMGLDFKGPVTKASIDAVEPTIYSYLAKGKPIVVGYPGRGPAGDQVLQSPEEYEAWKKRIPFAAPAGRDIIASGEGQQSPAIAALKKRIAKAKPNPLHEKAVSHFGLTSDHREAGYILPDGRMLDFSNKRDGGEPGAREYDHENISHAFDDKRVTRQDFINSGAARYGFIGDVVYVHHSKPLTKQQADAIARTKVGRPEYMIERTDENGNNHEAPAEGSGRSGFLKALKARVSKPEEEKAEEKAATNQKIANKIVENSPPAGKTDSPQFKQWFGDPKADPASASKVVDKEGNPIVAYHGTAKGGFTKFETAKIGEGNLYGPGFYFTEDSDIADSYRDGKDVKIPIDHAKSLTIPPELREEFLKDVYANNEAHRPKYMYADGADKERERIGRNVPEFMKSGSIYDLVKHDYWGTLHRDRGHVDGWQLHLVSPLAKKYGLNFNPGGETKSVYLNIRNPKRISEEFATKADHEAMRKFFKENPQGAGWDAFHMKKILEKLEPEHLKAAKVKARDLEEHNDPKWATIEKAAKAFHAKGDPRFPDPEGKKIRWDGLMYILSDGANYDRPRKAMVEYLKSKGYDGLSHDGGGLVSPGSKTHKVWIAFHPNQIKSVDNKGTFDPGNDDMLHIAGENAAAPKAAEATPAPSSPIAPTRHYEHASDDVVQAHADVLRHGKELMARAKHVPGLEKARKDLNDSIHAFNRADPKSDEDWEAYRNMTASVHEKQKRHAKLESNAKRELARISAQVHAKLANPSGPGDAKAIKRLSKPRLNEGEWVIRPDGSRVKHGKYEDEAEIPRDWSYGVSLFNHIAGKHERFPDRVVFHGVKERGGRSYSDFGKHLAGGNYEYSGNVHLARGDATTPTIMHEMGHILEGCNPEIYKEAVAFREARRKGEDWKPLRVLNMNPRGDRNHSFDDEWISNYTGKKYDDHVGATEVVSTGLEHLARDPIGFAKKDPGHFQFTLHVLRKYGGKK